MNSQVRKTILIATVAVSILSCRDAEQATATPMVTSNDVEQPADNPEAVDFSTNAVSTNGTEPEALKPPPALEFSPPGSDGLQMGWASIEARDDPDQRGWIEGTTERPDVIVIETENVSQFKLNLPHLGVNWSKRIALRIDGSTSELTKKRWPSMVLLRTPAGAWVVAE